MSVRHLLPTPVVLLLAGALMVPTVSDAQAQRTNRPVLHGQHWIAITGKPLGATAGAMTFQRGGNAVDAAAAMLAATATMWDVLSWGGETQALIYNPHTQKVIGINALGVAPTGATPEFFAEQGMEIPPEYGPLAAVTPGTPGGLMRMVSEFGTLSLAEILAPAIDMADGYPIEEQAANAIEANKHHIKQWPYSAEVFLPHLGSGGREAPYPGEIFRQPDLAVTLRKLVEAEADALAAGKSREEAINAAYLRFYEGDIAEEIVRGTREQGGLFTTEDLANWQEYIEEPVVTNYKGVDVYKLTHWVQGPVMLQTLNILENFDLASMGFNSSRYMHTLYQSMNLAFADRDFYYGDPYFPPEEPIEGLLSKDYAKQRAAMINWDMNDPDIGPGDPYPFQNGTNPFQHLRESWNQEVISDEDGEMSLEPQGDANRRAVPRRSRTSGGGLAFADYAGVQLEQPRGGYDMSFEEGFYAGTTSIQAADAEGWVVSITPSGGWIPAVIAGNTGVGLSQRMQSFVLDARQNPYNVVEPGKRPRATLTPSMALKDGKPFLSFAVQGGDSQDQNLVQFLLNVVEWGMDVQEAAEAPNINSFQMRSSFGVHDSAPGRILVQEDTSPWVVTELRSMGYEVRMAERTSGPITAIWFDWEHGTLWGGASDHGEDYGIAW